MKHLVFFIILIFASIIRVNAQEIIHPIDKQEQECLKKYYSTADMNKCIIMSIDLWEQKIKTTSKQIESLLATKDKNLFQKSQKSWEKHYKAEKTLINKTLYIKKGTIYTNIAKGLILDIAKQRALYLENYLNYISR